MDALCESPSDFSIWERTSLLTADVLIIGGGLTGCAVAASLIEAVPSLDVLVLEAGILPNGASTRNAGFACFGSLTELLADRQSDEQQAAQTVALRWHGLQRMRTRLTDSAIGYEPLGGWELIAAHSLPALDHLESMNAWLNGVLPGFPGYSLHPQTLEAYGFRGFEALVFNPWEGVLDTGKLNKSYYRYITRCGVRYLTGCQVTALHSEPDGVALEAAASQPGRPRLTFKGRVAALCTNAFTRTLWPDAPLAPGRGQVLLTEPIAELPFRGAFHLDEGYYYFRHVGERVLLGGGRNLDFTGETTSVPGLTDAIQQHLETLLRTQILPHQSVEIASRWSGIMAFGDVRRPITAEIQPGIVAGVRMGGMGVALSSEIGDQVAAMLLQKMG